MLEFIAGLATGTVAFAAISFALASRKDRRAREQMRRFAEMQTAIFDVQDQVSFCALNRAGSESVENRRLDSWRIKVAARDRAASAYFAAMGG